MMMMMMLMMMMMMVILQLPPVQLRFMHYYVGLMFVVNYDAIR